MSGRLFGVYERLGVRFVSLDEALADSVHDDEPHQWEVTTGNLLAQTSAVRRRRTTIANIACCSAQLYLSMTEKACGNVPFGSS
jgi:hypothetical protein